MGSGVSRPGSKIRVAILYPTDPAGHVPSGIDSFIRGILKWAPEDIEYTLLGASSDVSARPVGKDHATRLGDRLARFIPLTTMDASGTRGRIPLTVRYMAALKRFMRQGKLDEYDILDFHRIEPVWLFRKDRRPKNVILHQDMTVIRDKNSDIMWRHFPWIYEAIEHRLFVAVPRIFAVRQSAVDRYARLYPDLADRFEFIPTWVDTTVFHPLSGSDTFKASDRTDLRRRLGVDTAARMLVFVGRLDNQKDPLLLLQAFARVLERNQALHLLMIGDGNLRARVEEAAMQGVLRGKVTLMGVRPAAEIADVLRVCDLFVLSSAYEGMPIAVLEALASGVPVVTTDVGEVRRVVRDGITGRVSVARTAEAFADALELALQELAAISGDPCEEVVSPYHPEGVLNRIFENHRLQGSSRRVEARL